MATTYEDIDINQGADIAIELDCVDEDGSVKNLTNHSIAAKMKRTYNSTDASDIQAFNAIVQSPSDAGKLTLSLTNAQTSTLRRGRYVYDAELSFVDSDDNTIIERILEGQINVIPQVT
jgi:hypothetical protein|tara:strand:- start:180 stop:536 length:357 start_codon:yes stop_codon:yes gene_type:complete